MSKAYSINYDLKAPGGNYSGLYEVIKKFGIWWHYMESTWLISTDETARASGSESVPTSIRTTTY